MIPFLILTLVPVEVRHFRSVQVLLSQLFLLSLFGHTFFLNHKAVCYLFATVFHGGLGYVHTNHGRTTTRVFRPSVGVKAFISNGRTITFFVYGPY